MACAGDGRAGVRSQEKERRPLRPSRDLYRPRFAQPLFASCWWQYGEPTASDSAVPLPASAMGGRARKCSPVDAAAVDDHVLVLGRDVEAVEEVVDGLGVTVRASASSRRLCSAPQPVVQDDIITVLKLLDEPLADRLDDGALPLATVVSPEPIRSGQVRSGQVSEENGEHRFNKASRLRPSRHSDADARR